jgi:hypothetical protein
MDKMDLLKTYRNTDRRKDAIKWSVEIFPDCVKMMWPECTVEIANYPMTVPEAKYEFPIDDINVSIEELPKTKYEYICKIWKGNRKKKIRGITCKKKEQLEEICEAILETQYSYRKEKALEREKNLDYDSAINLYEKINLPEEAARIRRLKADLSAPKTEIHGDYVDDRDTIVKDSVINRSNVGAGGKTKGERIKLIKELLDSGAIDDDEFKQMKKEILGK